MSDTLIFIPAWNEEDNLPFVLDGLRTVIPDADVLVVDDGSTDNTAEVARERGVAVRSLGTNRGLRVAIPTGYRWALDHGYAYCGRVDADGSIRPRSSHGCSRSCEPTRATSPSVRGSCPATGTPRTDTGNAAPAGSRCAAAPGDEARPPPPLRRCDERSLRRERQGAASAGAYVRQRRAGGRGR